MYKASYSRTSFMCKTLGGRLIEVRSFIKVHVQGKPYLCQMRNTEIVVFVFCHQVLLDKLHRQARVEEEVKIVLKEYYKHREIDKNEYKSILRKAVPQVIN